MNRRLKHLALGAALLISAGLALFGDNSPEDDLSPLAQERSTRSAPEPGDAAAAAPRPSATPAWQPRDAQDIAAWVAQPSHLFKPIASASAEPASAAASSPGASAALPLAVIGRSLGPGPRTVYLQTEPGAEPVSARVGSVVQGFEVVTIEADAVVLRHRDSGQTISLPTGGPYGVFDVGAGHASQ